MCAGRRCPAPPRKKPIVRKTKEFLGFNEPQDLEKLESWLAGDKPITDTGSDPWKLNDAPGFCNMSDDTRSKYLATWEQFLGKYEICVGRPPTFAMVYQFFEWKFHKNYSAATITSMYSHLQMGFTKIYHRSLGDRRQIFE